MKTQTRASLLCWALVVILFAALLWAANLRAEIEDAARGRMEGQR